MLTLVYVAVFVTVASGSSEGSDSSKMDFLSSDLNVGRTFGHNALKRLSFIFLPVMFTLGVISTLLMALAVISVKNLAIGVMLLIVAVSQAVSRLFLTAASPSPLVHLSPAPSFFLPPLCRPLACGRPCSLSLGQI